VPPLTSRAPRLAATLVTTALAATTLISATPAHAAGVATAAPLRFALPGTDTATDVLAVGADVWVSAGNSVLILSRTGQVKKTVTGVLGAKGLTLSPDAHSVYVSSGTASKIVQLSAAGAIMNSWTSHGCPGKSAIAGGALYYAYGCSGATTGVGRLDLTSHADTSVLESFSAQSLTAAGSTLVTYTSGGSGYDMTSYTIGADGSLTRNAAVQTGGMKDAELSPDGSRLITTDYDHGYGVARYNATTLTLDGTFATGAYPSAVAWSPDGQRFAGILSASYDTRPVQVFSAQTGAAVTKSTTAGSTPYDSRFEAAWSADGALVYSLSQAYQGPAYLIVTPAAGQAANTLAVSVTAPKAYGKNATVTVRAPKRPGTTVTVTVGQTSKALRTNGAGVATWSFPAKSSSAVTATAEADLTYLAASGTARLVTPTFLSARMVGSTKVTKGVAHYRTVAAVQANLQIYPRRSGLVAVTLQHRAGGQWITDQKATFTTRPDGTVTIILSRGARKVTYRFLAKATADTSGGTSPTTTSASFIVD
jgi:WD40 repeat protein